MLEISKIKNANIVLIILFSKLSFTVKLTLYINFMRRIGIR